MAIRPSRTELLLWAGTVRTARHVTDARRFALNELLLRRRTRRYTLAESGRQVIVRHPIVDAFVVGEVLGGAYSLPSQVQRALDGEGPLRIVELGGHIGTMTLAMLDRFSDSTVTVYEAHPDNARILTAAVGANGAQDRVTVHARAAGAAPGRLELSGASALAHSSEHGEEVLEAFPYLRRILGESAPVTVEVEDVLPIVCQADFLKIDIEGGEWPILADPRFKDAVARALVIEYHRMGAPGEDAAAEARRLIGAAGFEVSEPFGVTDDVGMLWAWR